MVNKFINLAVIASFRMISIKPFATRGFNEIFALLLKFFQSAL